MKQVLAFDLDGTLAESKSPLDNRMAMVLNKLLRNFQLCVISGGKFEQFEKQLLANLKADPADLERVHILPTCGTRYYIYNTPKSEWELVYAEDLTAPQKQKIIDAFKQAAAELGLLEANPWGEIIEDRESQITYSALGQQAPVTNKEAWDPDNSKKARLRDRMAELIPEFEVRSGGLTSVDVTKPGVDKAYGMRKLLEHLHLSKEDILFFGDRLQPGGNDFPVKEMGIDSVEVSDWQQAASILEVIDLLTRA